MSKIWRTSRSSRSLLGKKEKSDHSSNFTRYKIIKTLGEGRYGKVKLAYDRKEEKNVAIKIMNRKTLTDREIERITRELSVMQKLHHPHIVQPLDILEKDDETYLVMEFCEGGDLFDFIINAPEGEGLPPELFFRMFREMVSAVAYCHRHFVVHRDLKPENLLLTAENSIKVADFGFSREFELDSLLSTSCGSLIYAAPEVLSGKGYIGPAADVWSLGVVLYAMVTGALPWAGETNFQIAEHIGTANFFDTALLDKAPHVRNLLKVMLTVDPTKRPTLDSLLVHPWVWGDKPLLATLVRPFASNFVRLRSENTATLRLLKQNQKKDRYKRRYSGLANSSLKMTGAEKIRMSSLPVELTSKNTKKHSSKGRRRDKRGRRNHRSRAEHQRARDRDKGKDRYRQRKDRDKSAKEKERPGHKEKERHTRREKQVVS